MNPDALVFCCPQHPRTARSFRGRSSPEKPTRLRNAACGWAGLATLLLVLGCAKPPSPASLAWTPSDELTAVDTHGRGMLLVRPDHQLGRYDDLLIEHVGFRYREGQRWLSFRDEGRISSMLVSVIQGTQDGTIGIVSEPGPCVLAVNFFLTDLKLYKPTYYSTGSTTSFVRSFGEATLVMELRNSMTDTTLARFLQRRELGGGSGGGSADASLRRLGRVVAIAMRDMGQQLQKLTPPTAGGGNARCDGGMARVALGSH